MYKNETVRMIIKNNNLQAALYTWSYNYIPLHNT